MATQNRINKCYRASQIKKINLNKEREVKETRII
jgi:tRNA A-37 threonylcarbamoyl transferase component Bud32